MKIFFGGPAVRKNAGQVAGNLFSGAGQHGAADIQHRAAGAVVRRAAFWFEGQLEQLPRLHGADLLGRQTQRLSGFDQTQRAWPVCRVDQRPELQGAPFRHLVGNQRIELQGAVAADLNDPTRSGRLARLLQHHGVALAGDVRCPQ
jgi:hypothetical protein